jgi:hypothetical protein
MRKSLILASFLFSTSVFADCDHVLLYLTQPGTSTQNPGLLPDACTSMSYDRSGGAGTTYCESAAKQCYQSGESECYCATYHYSSYPNVNTCPAGTTQSGSTCVPDDHSCASGYSFSSYAGGCVPTPPPPYGSNDDPSRGLDQFDGDPSGCDGAGGVYMTSGRCNTTGEAIAEIFQNPNAVVGAMLTIGGIAFAGTGIVALPITGGGSALAVSAGSIATLAGLGMMGIAAGGAIAYNPENSAPSLDVTTPEFRIKVSTIKYNDHDGSSVTATDPNSGKVVSSTFVPDAVKATLPNPANVDITTGELSSPIPLGGIQSTIYDYTTNTATTVTHAPTSTSSVPVVSTSTSPFTVTQNLDGTVTTAPTDSSTVPTVSGSGGGSVVSAPSSYNSGTDTGSGTGTGTTTGDGTDYTGLLTDIKSNTGTSSGFLSDIKSLLDGTGLSNDPLSDGSDSFSTLDGDAKSAISGFVFTDPLGLNNVASNTIDTYSFTILGHTFVLFDQALLNSLPLEMIRNMMLFIFAVLGFIAVFKGV